MHTSTIRRLAIGVTLVLAGCIRSIPINEYGLQVIETPSQYRRTVAEDPANRLVDLGEEIPELQLDIRYATENNFMHRRLYPVAAAWLRAPAADALRAIEEELRARGLGLKVFDAYRPYRVTRMMWEPYKDPDFVADPAKGSRHNRGAAVDLTIIDLATGQQLPMPTPYDAFTEKAAHAYQDLPDVVLRNRALLRDVMERHGFDALPSEWWHYDFRGWQRFALMDIPLETLSTLE